MAYSPDTRAYRGPGATVQTAAVVDAGLRAYLLRVYNWMASGLLLTAIVAYGIANTSLLGLFWQLHQLPNGAVGYGPTGLAYLAMFAPLAFVLVMSFGVNRLSTTAVQALFWAFCVAMGASLTNIFLVYAHESIATVFVITAAMFAGMSIYGYTTRADLSRMGSFLIMGLFGIIIAGLINMFIGSSQMQMIISVLGVLIFTGLTAYDTQRIKSDYVNVTYSYGPEAAAKRAVYDSLILLLNFINLFMFLLQLMGNRNSNSN
jgi:FtsH-binding integral membrane protein